MNANLEEHLIKKLPGELVDHIKLYTGHAYWRNGKFYNVKKIDKNDIRYTILRNMPKIKQIHNNYFEQPKRGAVWFKLENGKFITISVRYKLEFYTTARVIGYFWEFHCNQKCENYFIGI